MKVKYKAWSNTYQYMIGNTEQEYEGKVYQWVAQGQDLTIIPSTGLTNTKDEIIWYGDIYWLAGYGSLVVEELHDVMQVMEAKGENDLGVYLGNKYEHPDIYEQAGGED